MAKSSVFLMESSLLDLKSVTQSSSDKESSVSRIMKVKYRIYANKLRNSPAGKNNLWIMSYFLLQSTFNYSLRAKFIKRSGFFHFLTAYMSSESETSIRYAFYACSFDILTSDTKLLIPKLFLFRTFTYVARRDVARTIR